VVIERSTLGVEKTLKGANLDTFFITTSDAKN
jgi:hypothetical protein